MCGLRHSFATVAACHLPGPVTSPRASPRVAVGVGTPSALSSSAMAWQERPSPRSLRMRARTGQVSGSRAKPAPARMSPNAGRDTPLHGRAWHAAWPSCARVSLRVVARRRPRASPSIARPVGEVVSKSWLAAMSPAPYRAHRCAVGTAGRRRRRLHCPLLAIAASVQE